MDMLGDQVSHHAIAYPEADEVPEARADKPPMARFSSTRQRRFDTVLAAC